MENIGLTIVGTNKYSSFLPELALDALINFLPSHNLEIFCFSDKKIDFSHANKYLKNNRSITPVYLKHEPWPNITMKRFSIIKNLPSKDYHYYLDADSKIIDTIGEEILSKRVALAHHALTGRGLPEESIKESQAYIEKGIEFQYAHAAFQGGSSFQSDCIKLDEMTEKDKKLGIIPIWHDESYWNRYLIDNPATKMLPQGYLTREFKKNEYTKIIDIIKDNDSIR